LIAYTNDLKTDLLLLKMCPPLKGCRILDVRSDRGAISELKRKVASGQGEPPVRWIRLNFWIAFSPGKDHLGGRELISNARHGVGGGLPLEVRQSGNRELFYERLSHAWLTHLNTERIIAYRGSEVCCLSLSF